MTIKHKYGCSEPFTALPKRSVGFCFIYFFIAPNVTKLKADRLYKRLVDWRFDFRLCYVGAMASV